MLNAGLKEIFVGADAESRVVGQRFDSPPPAHPSLLTRVLDDPGLVSLKRGNAAGPVESRPNPYSEREQVRVFQQYRSLDFPLNRVSFQTT